MFIVKCILHWITLLVFSVYSPNWKNDGDERNAVQTLEASESCCEDDMDTFTSDTEKELDPDRQIIDKKESMSHKVMYAMPHKIKQVSF